MTTVPDPPLPTGTPARMSSAENPRGLPPEQWGDRFRPRTWRTDPERPLMVLALFLDLVTLALGVGLYGHQPELVPIGWGDDGQPDRWAPRSWPLVLSIPATGLLATLGLWALAATRAPAPPRYPRTVDGMLRAHAVTACTRAAVGWVAVLTALTVAVLGGRAWTANTLPGLVSLTVLLLMIAALAMAWLETTQQNAMIDAELLARRLPVGPCLSAQHRIWRHGMVADDAADPRLLLPGGPFGAAPNIAHPRVRALMVLSAVVLTTGALTALFVLPPLSW